MSDNSSQSYWFVSDTDSSTDGEAGLLARYDIVYTEDQTVNSLKGYHGDNIVIPKISNRRVPRSDEYFNAEQPTEEFRYKAYLHWASFEAVFTC
ncbi:hypothetical protein IFR04_013839 [Cadophora malorum]|uniref:Uncharacterized protein n=1 Tax=Cadophora malorum TaxID=108018 RepID=A0A8H7T694_9HELO|nr:hypothetical protein IFR04_013839 [Cadophora malorum]